MAAGRVAAQENAVGVAAVVADVLADPGEGAGHVLDLLRVLDVRRQAVVDADGDGAVAGEEAADAAVVAEHALVAEHPRPAVDEQHHRPAGRPLRREHVQRLPVGAVGITHVQRLLQGRRFVGADGRRGPEGRQDGGGYGEKLTHGCSIGRRRRPHPHYTDGRGVGVSRRRRSSFPRGIPKKTWDGLLHTTDNNGIDGREAAPTANRRRTPERVCSCYLGGKFAPAVVG